MNEEEKKNKKSSITELIEIKQFFINIKKGFAHGVGFLLAISTGTALAVAVTGPFNFFAPGTLLKSNDINTNFTTLKAAIENIEASAPVGTIVAYGGVTAPPGWFLCNGQTVSRTTYAGLYAVIGNSYGSGDGSSTFHLPDFRGRFLRGLDGTANIDPDKATRTAMNTGGNTGNAIGSVQGDEFKNHTHLYATYGGTDNDRDDSHTGSGLAHPSPNQPTSSVGGNETRPVNAYVNWIVKQ